MCGAILTFYTFKSSTIVSSEFVLMRLSYVSVAKAFNAVCYSSKLYICCICCSYSSSVCEWDSL